MADRLVLVTGFPTSFLATRIVRELLDHEPETRVVCVVPDAFKERAQKTSAKFSPEKRARLTLLEGDVAAMDLGLSGREFLDLAHSIDVIHHAAAASYLGADRDAAQRINVDGTREVLELAQAATRLSRLVHWSTTLVSGTQRGVFREGDVDRGEFRNPIEETRARAERLVRRAVSEVPTTILRPSIIVGDSETGEIDRFEGPYLLVLLMLNAPVDLRVPIPGPGDVPLHLVPVDYVVRAGLQIANDTRSIGKTFHLVDPKPGSARAVFERIAKMAGRPSPLGAVPANVATVLLRTPGLERFAQAPRAFLEQLATDIRYDDGEARHLLEGTAIRCAPYGDVVDAMVRWVRDQHASKAATQSERGRRRDEEPNDPLSR